jgi:nucleoside-diphosphate-sugar epimerase
MEIYNENAYRVDTEVWENREQIHANGFVEPNDVVLDPMCGSGTTCVLSKKNNEPSVTIWGTGTPRREFLHVDDLADACYFLLQNYTEKG